MALSYNPTQLQEIVDGELSAIAALTADRTRKTNIKNAIANAITAASAIGDTDIDLEALKLACAMDGVTLTAQEIIDIDALMTP